MTALKFAVPEFLKHLTSQAKYERWLRAKAAAHANRDQKRGLTGVTAAAYRSAIHQAVLESNGRDAYTGELLDWKLLSQYDNTKSKAGRHGYKKSFGLLPTVDHVEASARTATFRICAWRTNDAKHDLSTQEFIELCARVVQHAGFKMIPPSTQRT